MEWETDVRVRFPLADCAGIMFFGNAFILAHEVLENFILATGFTWAEWFDRADWGLPYRHAEADYMRPVLPGTTLRASACVTHMGTSSVIFRIRFRNTAGEMMSEVRLVAATVDRNTMTKQPTPEIVRERLAPYRVDPDAA